MFEQCISPPYARVKLSCKASSEMRRILAFSQGRLPGDEGSVEPESPRDIYKYVFGLKAA